MKPLLDWNQLFPDADYRFTVGLRRGEAARFYAPTPEREAVLAERARWLKAEPEEYFVHQPEADALVPELLEMATTWHPALASELNPLNQSSPREVLFAYAHHCEPDFLLLKPDKEGRFRLVAGSVCFPSSWVVAEKLGRTVPEIHEPVPGLNSTLGRQIDTFLQRLTPGVSWERENWGLARCDEMNYHPRRALPRLVSPVRLADVWLRVEQQSFIALPRTGGVLFGIRLVVVSLTEVARDAEAARRLSRALRTMPAEVAAYKGLDLVRAELAAQLDGWG